MREDYYTTTEADAGAFARAHADEYADDRPTLAELERDEYESRFPATLGVNEDGGVKCAHCKGKHATVADVRQCADAYAEGQAEAKAEQEWEAACDVAFAKAQEARGEMWGYMQSQEDPPF